MRNKQRNSEHKGKLITNLEPKSPVSEEYRTIRTNIQFSSVDKEVKRITVTSTGPNEGKSTTVANLAVVFAQQGKKVIVVDADLRKPSIDHIFNLKNSFGLTNVLSRTAQLNEAIIQTDIDQLYVLTSGPVPPNPSELLGSKAMENLIEQLYDEFDLILFDTPPVLVVPDAKIIANKSEGTILVVSSGKTEKANAERAKDALLSAQAPILGVVLNNKKLDDATEYYYYGS